MTSEPLSFACSLATRVRRHISTVVLEVLSMAKRTQEIDQRRFRPSLPTLGLGPKMLALGIAGVLLLVGSLAFIGSDALKENTNEQLKDRVILAQNTARHMDYVLANIENTMTDPEARGCWLTWEKATTSLDCTYHRLSFFASHVLLIDPIGQVVASYPPLSSPNSLAGYASVQMVLNGSSFAISRFYRPLDEHTSSALAVAPIDDDTGQIRGALVAAIDLAGPGIRTFSSPLDLGETGYMDLVDMGGTVMASTRSGRVGQPSDHRQTLSNLIAEHHESVSMCHDCHIPDTSAPPPQAREILAFSPLTESPWGIAVRQNEDEVLANTNAMQRRMSVLLAVSLAGALVLIFLSTRSVLSPIRTLTTATQRLASGDLDTPLQMERGDELGALARSFDHMRARLRTSIAEIRTWNSELDKRVQEQTAQCKASAIEIGTLYEELRAKEQARKGLLHRILSVQEDERKRISRELHDETCQIFLTLAFGLENVGEMVSDQAPASEILPQLDKLRTLAKSGRDEVNRLIFDLRPMMLDHLGLVAALRWYAEMRLGGSQVQFATREVGSYLRGSPMIETTLFRVGQEAINNIAQHAQARHADITFEYTDGHIGIQISDDGIGFDPAAASDAPSQRGLGLIGMEERVSSLNGDFELRSTPGAGTIIRLKVPRNGNGHAL